MSLALAKAVGVVVRLGDEIIAEATANAWRPDLVAAGIGDGYHAFNLMFGRMLSGQSLAAVTVEVSGEHMRSQSLTMQSA